MCVKTEWLCGILLGVAVAALGSDNLTYGVLGKADQVVDREGYALGYKAAWKTARWVTYRLTDDEVLMQVARRSESFAPDPQIPNGPQLEDYRGSGYDRGHLAPAADMKWSVKAMTECFYLSNMVPQDRGNNAGIWNEIENTVRGFACAEGLVFVVTGPITPDPPVLSIGKGRVAVPAERSQYTCDEDVRGSLNDIMKHAVETKDKNFGNGRFVRNLFEKAIQRQAERLSTAQNLTSQMLAELTLHDLGFKYE